MHLRAWFIVQRSTPAKSDDVLLCIVIKRSGKIAIFDFI
jgi:hypothetical protein